MSVGEVAGAKDSKFRMLRALKKLDRSSNFAASPMKRARGKLKFLPKDTSKDVYPGPAKMFRQAQPVPLVVVSNSAAGFGKMPFIHCCLDGLAIAPPEYLKGMSGQ